MNPIFISIVCAVVASILVTVTVNLILNRKRKARYILHFPGNTVFCCRKHRREMVLLAGIFNMHVEVEKMQDKSPGFCYNCITEKP